MLRFVPTALTAARRERLAAPSELDEPLAHLILIMQEDAVGTVRQIDPVQQVEGPCDDLIVERGIGRRSVPLGCPSIGFIA